MLNCVRSLYRGVNKGLYVLLSRTQAGPGRKVKQEQEEISRNHVQSFIYLSVQVFAIPRFSVVGVIVLSNLTTCQEQKTRIASHHITVPQFKKLRNLVSVTRKSTEPVKIMGFEVNVSGLIWRSRP